MITDILARTAPVVMRRRSFWNITALLRETEVSLRRRATPLKPAAELYDVEERENPRDSRVSHSSILILLCYSSQITPQAPPHTPSPLRVDDGIVNANADTGSLQGQYFPCHGVLDLI